MFTHQHEVARVRHQHEPIAVPIAADLIALRGEPGIVIGRLHFDHAALRRLPLARSALLHLLCRIEAEVGMPRPMVSEFLYAEHLRL